KRGVFSQARGEAKYVEVARAVVSMTEPRGIIMSAQHSGSIRYYAGRLTLRWDLLESDWLDRAADWLEAEGYHLYLLLEEPEIKEFRARFGSSGSIGRLDWIPIVKFRGGAVQLFDVTRRGREQGTLNQADALAIRGCLEQQPFPTLR